MKDAILIKINKDNSLDEVQDIRRQLVSSLKSKYNIVFLPEDIELDDIKYEIIKENIRGNGEWMCPDCYECEHLCECKPIA